jgi:branched-chain amino acid transport system substrate-binding protein
MKAGQKFWRCVSAAATVLAVGVIQFSTSSVASAAGGPPITVGVICSCSGTFGAEILPAYDVYKSWANKVNSSGGLNGHQVQLTLEDDAGNPGTSVSEIQTLISDHVDVIVDISILTTAWASTVQASKIPVVGVNETEVAFYQFSDFYSPGQTADSSNVANAATAKAAGVKTIANFYCSEAAACQQGVPLLAAAGKKVGVNQVYTAAIAATAPNYTAQCLAAQQAGVKGIFIGDVSFVIINAAKDCAQQNFDPVWLTEGEGFGLNEASAQGLSTKMWSEYGNIPFFVNSPAVKAMNSAVDQYYPGLRANANTWTQIGLQGWASGLLLKDAVKASGLGAGGTPSPAQITKGLTSLKGDTLQGMSPPLTFKAGKAHPIDCWFTARVANGVPTLVNSGKTTCSKS